MIDFDGVHLSQARDGLEVRQMLFEVRSSAKVKDSINVSTGRLRSKAAQKRTRSHGRLVGGGGSSRSQFSMNRMRSSPTSEKSLTSRSWVRIRELPMRTMWLFGVVCCSTGDHGQRLANEDRLRLGRTLVLNFRRLVKPEW